MFLISLARVFQEPQKLGSALRDSTRVGIARSTMSDLLRITPSSQSLHEVEYFMLEISIWVGLNNNCQVLLTHDTCKGYFVPSVRIFDVLFRANRKQNSGKNDGGPWRYDINE